MTPLEKLCAELRAVGEVEKKATKGTWNRYWWHEKASPKRWEGISADSGEPTPVLICEVNTTKSDHDEVLEIKSTMDFIALSRNLPPIYEAVARLIEAVSNLDHSFCSGHCGFCEIIKAISDIEAIAGEMVK